MEGVYSLKQAIQDGLDVTEDFLLYQVSFDGAEMKVVINYMNMLVSRSSTYKATAEQVVETYQGETFEYTVEGNTSAEEGLIPNGGTVAKKRYRLDDRRIAGYGRPDYKE